MLYLSHIHENLDFTFGEIRDTKIHQPTNTRLLFCALEKFEYHYVCDKNSEKFHNKMEKTEHLWNIWTFQNFNFSRYYSSEMIYLLCELLGEEGALKFVTGSQEAQKQYRE